MGGRFRGGGFEKGLGVGGGEFSRHNEDVFGERRLEGIVDRLYVETWNRGNRERGRSVEGRSVGRGHGGKRREVDALEEGMALLSIEFAGPTSSSAVFVAPSRFCGVLARSRRIRSYDRSGLEGLRARIPPRTRGTPWIPARTRRFSRRSDSYASLRALSPTRSLLRTARSP